MTGVFQELQERGYAIVRGVLTPPEIADMTRAFNQLVERARVLATTSDHSGSRFVVEPDPFRLHRVVWCGGASPTLARLGDDPRILRLAAEALRRSSMVQLIQQAHFKLPGDEVDFPLHQDASNRRFGTDEWTDVDGRGSFIQIAMPVDPMGPENGGLQLVEGSHRLGFIAEPGTGALPPEFVRRARPITPQLQPGDALLFGPFLVHGSGPNRSGRPRRLFIQGYAAPGANRRMYPGCGLGVMRSQVDEPAG